MGLQDREYMHRRPEERASNTHEPVRRPADRYMWILVAIAVVAVAGVAIWARAPTQGWLVVNINTATQEQLETVPGIGPVLARSIIAGRPYDGVRDLLDVPGIGERKFERMRPFVKTVGETQRK